MIKGLSVCKPDDDREIIDGMTDRSTNSKDSLLWRWGGRINQSCQTSSKGSLIQWKDKVICFKMKESKASKLQIQ